MIGPRSSPIAAGAAERERCAGDDIPITRIEIVVIVWATTTPTTAAVTPICAPSTIPASRSPIEMVSQVPRRS